jgi:hypothetical protein
MCRTVDPDNVVEGYVRVSRCLFAASCQISRTSHCMALKIGRTTPQLALKAAH